ncbi:hypothetical protein FAIPA1_40120 [Frankia sp. AiPs1]
MGAGWSSSRPDHSAAPWPDRCRPGGCPRCERQAGLPAVAAAVDAARVNSTEVRPEGRICDAYGM